VVDKPQVNVSHASVSRIILKQTGMFARGYQSQNFACTLSLLPICSKLNNSQLNLVKSGAHQVNNGIATFFNQQSINQSINQMVYFRVQTTKVHIYYRQTDGQTDSADMALTNTYHSKKTKHKCLQCCSNMLPNSVEMTSHT